MKPTWTEGAYSIHYCRIGVLLLTVQPEGNKWKMDLGGTVAKARWDGLEAAKDAALSIAKKWIAEAAKACEGL